MRMLLFLRGLPGSGKSTFVYNHHLQDYTVSTDKIRQLLGSNVLNVNGKYTINNEINNMIWRYVHEILNERFKLGAFTVFDATNIKGADIQKVYKMAKPYRYRAYCVDFTDVSKEECIARDAKRDENKRVGRETIERMYASLQNNKVPPGIKVIKPEDWLSETAYRTQDISEYKKVHHIGDIHGCYTALQDYLQGDLKDDEFYVFIGDYIDRGIENVQTLKFIANISERPNVVLLEGNHEARLREYIDNEPSVSKDFELKTRIEFDNYNPSEMKSVAGQVLRKVRQCFIYKWNGKTVLCTHGGISKLPSNLSLINAQQMIKGVGVYQDMLTVNESFEAQNKNREVYQVHGHRNVEQVPIEVNSRCFNLCEHIEYGGNLRCLELDKDGFHSIYVKNPVYDKKDENVVNDVGEMLDLLQTNPNIKITRQEGTHIYSYNFTRKAFTNGVWDKITTKARGLFINEVTCEIVARGYNKFFNINERPETNLDVLPNTISYPVTAYKKENGFLGLLGYDKESDSLLFCSKSLMSGTFSDYFRNIILSSVSEEDLYNYMKDKNVTLAFEVIDVKNDPHIIEYRKSRVILLDIIENSVEFNHKPYEEVVKLAQSFNIECKEKSIVLNNADEFKDFATKIQEDSFKWNGSAIEGFVFEDTNKFMFKFKTPYYKFWKAMRSQIEAIANGRSPRVKHPFLDWVEEDITRCSKSIIELRKEYSRMNKK